MFGGRSVIDPDGFPFSAKQTSTLNMVTPRSQGGPTENDPSPNGSDSKESGQDGDPGKKAAEAADKANFEKMEKEIKEALAKNPKLDKLKDQVQFARDKDGLRIEISDNADFAMFPSGAAGMQGKASALITTTADYWLFYDDHVFMLIKPMSIVNCIFQQKMQYVAQQRQARVYAMF
jgi:chemotaxis protein MotB